MPPTVPTGIPSVGYWTAKLVTTIADTAAPKLATEINAVSSVAAECIFGKSWGGPSATYEVSIRCRARRTAEPRGSAKSVAGVLTCCYVCDWCGACRYWDGVGLLVTMELPDNRRQRAPHRHVIFAHCRRFAHPVGAGLRRGARPAQAARAATCPAGGIGVCRRCGARWCPDLGRGRRMDPRRRPGHVVPAGNRCRDTAADGIDLPTCPGRYRRR